MNSDGSQARSFYKPEGYELFAPMWLPSGRRILYGKYRNLGGTTDVVLESRDLNGSNPTVLLSNADLRAMSWAQPGRLLLGIRESPPRQQDINLWQIECDRDSGKPTSPLRRLTDWTGFAFASIASTSTGKTIVFQNMRQQSDVYIGELAESGATLRDPQRLTLDLRYDWPTAWSPDSKSVVFYSDLGGNFDLYRQHVAQHDIEKLTTGSEEKWAPQVTADGKWIFFMAWPANSDPGKASAKLMRVAASGGPAEFVADLKGRPSDAFTTVAGFPSFRCPTLGNADCVVAEASNGQETVFTAMDGAGARKREIIRLAGNPEIVNWALSPDGSRLAITTFDYNSANVQIVPVNGGAPQKYSVMPWNELVAVAWTSDGKALFLASNSSRGTALIRYDLGKSSKLLWKTTWDLFQITPSPDGKYLALGPNIYDANAWIISDLPSK